MPPMDLLPDYYEPDWSREYRLAGQYEPGKELLASLRLYQELRKRRDPVSIARCKMTVLKHRFWSIVCGADIPLTVKIGGGLLMPHPQGVVMHNDVEIGPNCLIMSQVTIGVTRKGGPPKIAGGVDIGTGAKILGPVTIGEGAQIGANAVVVSDVPANAIAVGIPARIRMPGDFA